MAERIRVVSEACGLSAEDQAVMRQHGGLSHEIADRMIENAVATFDIPLGIGTNFRINDCDHLVPMAVEEPSVVAAVSLAAKIVREGGGFYAEVDEPIMIGQLQITAYGEVEVAREALIAARSQIIALADSYQPQLLQRGGGARDIQVRVLPAPEGPAGEPLLILHILVDTRDAMGANTINTIAEGVAPFVEQITGGRVFLRILSNLADRRLARARCRVPVAVLADFGLSGEAVCEGIVQASRFAEADPYRAATHNKGVMNGIDAVALATGNDWRAIEAGAHAYAARSGRYGPLSVWRVNDGHLEGKIELPLAVGTVGGPIRVHPLAQIALKILAVERAQDLAGIMAAVGLAQNLAAIRALGSVGIQRGHMALHARCVAVTAGTPGEWVERVANVLVLSGQVKLDKAREVLAQLRAQHAATGTG